MKKLLIAIAVFGASFGAMNFVSAYSSNNNGEQCLPGSYEIGRADDGSPICKAEPTGCPYGDSIPLDSPKCAPSTPEEIQAAQNPTPAQTNNAEVNKPNPPSCGK